MYGTMPTSEPTARYAAPHTAETGRISAASSTRSDFLWRSSSSSSGSAPKRASRAAALSIHEVPARVRDRGGAIVSSSVVFAGGSPAPPRSHLHPFPLDTASDPDVSEGQR